MVFDLKAWNERHKQLRTALSDPAEHDQALDLFMIQHAAVHDSAVSNSESETWADSVWADLPEDIFRRIPQNEEHSIAWAIWHAARVEDVTMNLLVAGERQLLDAEDWLRRLGVDFQHTGNAMSEAEITALSAALDMDALRAYRAAVGRRTREIVGALDPDVVTQKVDPARIQRIWDEGAVLEDAREIVDYWSRRTIAGLLPPFFHFSS
jgi:hypothetical protein